MFKTNDICKEKQKRLAVTINSRFGKFFEPPQIKLIVKVPKYPEVVWLCILTLFLYTHACIHVYLRMFFEYGCVSDQGLTTNGKGGSNSEDKCTTPVLSTLVPLTHGDFLQHPAAGPQQRR